MSFKSDLKKIPRKMLIYPIRLYQKYISKLLGSNCRFTPSCSEYAAQAIDKYGIIIGSFKAIRRILRCHPFNEGGYDPLK
ncbi:MAG: membrane protein insertion efficiency factor YidD [Clostridia bacterium]